MKKSLLLGILIIVLVSGCTQETTVSDLPSKAVGAIQKPPSGATNQQDSTQAVQTDSLERIVECDNTLFSYACYTNNAIENKDDRYCELLGNTESKNYCYFEYATEFNDATMCQKINGMTDLASVKASADRCTLIIQTKNKIARDYKDKIILEEFILANLNKAYTTSKYSEVENKGCEVTPKDNFDLLIISMSFENLGVEKMCVHHSSISGGGFEIQDGQGREYTPPSVSSYFCDNAMGYNGVLCLEPTEKANREVIFQVPKIIAEAILYYDSVNLIGVDMTS